MVLSMTGYGRGECSDENMTVVVELRSVNHRYFEFSARVPRVLGFIDDKLKSLCQERISRGKVDMFVSVENAHESSTVVEINHSLAQGYVDAIGELSQKYEVRNDLSASALARFPDIITVRKEQLDEEMIWPVVRAATEQALDGFIKMRVAEGEKLSDDINSRVEFILDKVSFVEARSPETVNEYRQKLEARIREMLQSVSVDEQRLLTETAVFADKVAVAEETVRLRSHIRQLLDMMSSSQAVGRKLDFIVQEMNREANTIGSKASDVSIAHAVVDIKAEIEKIREQVQNIE